MREIKFRAWDPAQHKMLKPSYLEFIDGNAYWVEAGEDDSQNDGPIDSPVTRPVVKIGMVLEQYTGLKDVNGKPIYEGDIVKNSYRYAQPKVSEVIIEDGNTYISGEDVATGGDMLLCDFVDSVEVIGDIHQNKDLLEVWK